MPRSSCSSLWMLTSDGGIGTPWRTEKHSPWAWRGAVVRVLAEDQHLRLGVRREVQGGEHLVVRAGTRVRCWRSAATNACSSGQYGLANSPRRTGFQSVVIGAWASSQLSTAAHASLAGSMTTKWSPSTSAQLGVVAGGAGGGDEALALADRHDVVAPPVHAEHGTPSGRCSIGLAWS